MNTSLRLLTGLSGALILLLATTCSSRRVKVITPASEPLSSFSILAR